MLVPSRPSFQEAVEGEEADEAELAAFDLTTKKKKKKKIKVSTQPRGVQRRVRSCKCWAQRVAAAGGGACWTQGACSCHCTSCTFFSSCGGDSEDSVSTARPLGARGPLTRPTAPPPRRQARADDEFGADAGEEPAAGEDGAAAEGGAGAPGLSWEGSDRDYTYEEMLDRAFGILREHNPNLGGGKRRTTLKPPQVAREGTKKTVFTNFMELSKAMNRQHEHVQAYLLAEMGTSGSLDGQQRLIIKGRFAPKDFENILRRYVNECVPCDDFFTPHFPGSPKSLCDVHAVCQNAFALSVVVCGWRGGGTWMQSFSTSPAPLPVHMPSLHNAR